MATSKTVKTPPAPQPRKPWRPAWLALPVVEAASSSFRTVLINLTVLALVVLVVPLTATQFAKDQILLEPLSIPPALLATGLTPEVAANRLWDSIQQISIEAGSDKTTVNVVPESKKVTFSIPDAGISADSLVYYARQFFNLHQMVVSGELRCADAACSPDGVTMRLRVYGATLDVIDLPPMRRDTEAEYWRLAAAQVMAILDPFTALAAEATDHPSNAAALARRLIVSNHKDAKWADNILGNIRRQAGQLEDAKLQYQAALALDPSFPPALANMAGVTAQLHDYTASALWLDQIAKISPNSPLEAEGRGDLARAQGDFDTARDFYLEATKRDPLNGRYQTKAGLMLMEANRTEEGIAQLREVLGINPADPSPLAILSAYYLGLPDFDVTPVEAIYRDAAEFAPEDAAIQVYDGQMLMILKDYASALVRYDQAVLIDGGNASYRIKRADALAMLGRHEDALTDLAVADQRSPDNPDVVYAQARSLQSLNRDAEAIASYQRFLVLMPDGIYTPIVKAMIGVLQTKLAGETPAALPTVIGPTP